ncbi:MAG: hypothetical protein Q7T61_13540 [Caulobacter sp.]|nr:hypothetical protein [Caulobacter sp.]
MTPEQLLTELNDSKLFAAVLTAILSSGFGAYFGLRTFRQQAKELLDGAIAWQWVPGPGAQQEEPFLVMQNRSAVPAFIIGARFRRGLFIRLESQRYPFSYPEPMDGNYPLEIKAQSVTSFPVSLAGADRAAESAMWPSITLAYLFKRPYVWLEISTLSGRRLMIPANDATSFEDRPLWLEGRWLPRPVPAWLNEARKAKKAEEADKSS